MTPKDKIIFCTKADHKQPSKYDLPPALENEKRKGMMMPDGSIDWSCPCLGALPYGPCGFEFREFFGCLKLEEETKSECTEKFLQMKSCFSKFPKLYQNEDELED